VRQPVPTAASHRLSHSPATGKRRRFDDRPESTEVKGAGMNKDQV